MSDTQRAHEQDWLAAITGVHELSVQVDVLNFRGIPFNVPPLQVTKLEWRQDAAARPSLSAMLTVPMVKEWIPTSSDSLLTPFGNMVRVWLTVRSGEKFTKRALGFGLIQEVTMVRPEQVIEIRLTDLTDVLVNSYTKKTLPGTNSEDLTDWEWMKKIVDDANIQAWKRLGVTEVVEPHEEGLTLRDKDSRISRTHTIKNDTRWPAGTSRMAMLDDLAQRNPSDPSWLWLQPSGVLRVRSPAMTDATQAPTSAAHVIASGDGGALIQSTSSITRVGTINELTVRNDHPKKGERNRISTYHVKEGAVRRSRMAKRNAVEETSRRWTQDELDKYTKNRLIARAGARRQVTVTALINPYIGPGDAVVVNMDEGKELFSARTITINLPEATMTVESQGWVDEKLRVKKGHSPRPEQDPVKDDPPPEQGGRYPSDHKFKAVESGLANGAGTSESVKNSKAALRAVPVLFPRITTVYGQRSDSYRYHPQGLALDIMMPGSGDNSYNNPALGNSIVKFFIKNQKRFGIDYIMWDHRTWNAAYGGLSWSNKSWVNDRGGVTANHQDHIHLNTHPYSEFVGRQDAIHKGTYWRESGSGIVAFGSEIDDYASGSSDFYGMGDGRG